jgi:hypothetical protein
LGSRRGFQYDHLTRGKKRRYTCRLEHDYEEFKETIEELGLIDMENINGEFT